MLWRSYSSKDNVSAGDTFLLSDDDTSNKVVKQITFENLKKAMMSVASTTVAGIVKLSSAIDSNNETMAATPKAVKQAYDLATTVSPLIATPTFTSVSVTGNRGTLNAGGYVKIGKLIIVNARFTLASFAHTNPGYYTFAGQFPMPVTRDDFNNVNTGAALSCFVCGTGLDGQSPSAAFVSASNNYAYIYLDGTHKSGDTVLLSGVYYAE